MDEKYRSHKDIPCADQFQFLLCKSVLVLHSKFDEMMCQRRMKSRLDYPVAVLAEHFNIRCLLYVIALEGKKKSNTSGR